MYDDMKMGIDSTKEPIVDFNEMRRRIEMGARDSSLINQALMTASYQGLGGEDKYTLLAYHALMALEFYWKQALELHRLSPSPPMIVSGTGGGPSVRR